MNTSRITRIPGPVFALAAVALAFGLAFAQETVTAKREPEPPAPVASKSTTPLELANLKVEFLKLHREYVQKQLEITSVKQQAEDRVKALQAEIDPLMKKVQAAYAPLNATCKTGENYDPEAMECKAPPQPAHPPDAKTPPTPAKK